MLWRNVQRPLRRMVSTSKVDHLRQSLSEHIDKQKIHNQQVCDKLDKILETKCRYSETISENISLTVISVVGLVSLYFITKH